MLRALAQAVHLALEADAEHHRAAAERVGVADVGDHGRKQAGETRIGRGRVREPGSLRRTISRVFEWRSQFTSMLSILAYTRSTI